MTGNNFLKDNRRTLSLLALGSVTVASTLLLGGAKDAIPPELLLKTTADKVFVEQEYIEDGKAVVKYKYTADTEVPPSTLNTNDTKVVEEVNSLPIKDDVSPSVVEDVSMRTGNTQFFKVGKTEDGHDAYISHVFPKQQFVKDLRNGKWYNIEYATTTKQQFDQQINQQTKIGWLNKLRRIISPPAIADSSVFYPDPNAETTSVDGDVRRSSTEESFSTIRDGAGSTPTDSLTSFYAARLSADSTTDTFATLYRGFILFDTSSLPDDATLVSATLSLYGFSFSNTLGSDDLHVTSSSPASSTALATGDFGNIGRTSFGSLSYASATTSAYNDISLNSTGLATVSKTGITKLGTQLAWDLNNSFTGTWSSLGSTIFRFRSADQTGTSNDPYLTVVYTIGGGQATVPRRILIID